MFKRTRSLFSAFSL